MIDFMSCYSVDLHLLLFFGLQGVQPLLDGVLSYLPCPTEVSNYALDQTQNEEKVCSWMNCLFYCFPVFLFSDFFKELILSRIGYIIWNSSWTSGCVGF